jgi:hypothetical protein
MNNIVDKKISDRIRKLLAKARGTENEAEATMFAKYAAEMLQQHNLSEIDLGGEDASEPLAQRTLHSVDWNPWRISILRSLTSLYFSQFYITQEIFKGKLRRCMVIVGRPHNLDVVEDMQDYLVKTTIRLAKEYSSQRKIILDFEKGCGHRLAERIAVMAKQAQEPVASLEHQPSGNLPALYKSELQLAQDIVDRECGGAMARRSGHRTGGSGVTAGREAGNKVNLGGQISSTRKTGHLLT